MSTQTESGSLEGRPFVQVEGAASFITYRVHTGKAHVNFT